MGQFKQAFSQIGGGIKEDFRRLKHEFGVRSFFTILFGLALLGGNAYLFVASTIKMFAADGLVGLLRFGGGLLGFLVSCLLIFLVTVHFSVCPQEGVSDKEDKSVFSDKTPFGGKKRGLIATLVLLALITFGGGGTALGVYIAGEVKYNTYPETTATVVSVFQSGFDENRGYTAVYEYTVDGVTYTVKGELRGSGEAAPRIGDTVSVKYDPLNPEDLRIGTESKFFLGFGCFLIFFGLAVVAAGLYNAKLLKTQFFLAFILLGLTACIFVIYLAAVEFHGLVEFFARNYMLHFVLIFTNVGFLELVNGIVYIGYKK
ncbi:MAG: DUF3592 domain-containing protein [Clostridia bacterium]|nr:DUF3592 domain-containing protein [Clostridia bacterium]